MENLSKLVRGLKTIPSLPTIYIKVNEIVNDPMSSAADLGRVIEKDPALTSKLLRLVNSAFYGFSGRIKTVTRAITIIGFNQLRDLVLAASVQKLFDGVQDNGISIRNLWAHNLACGIASRVLAVHRGEKNPESFFVAGLLHDLGRLMMLANYPEKYLTVCQTAIENQCLIHEVEVETFGFTHAQIGGELGRVWKLPGSLIEAISYHHDPLKSTNSTKLTAVVHIADVLVHAFRFGFTCGTVPPLESESWRQVDLKVGDLKPVVDRIFEQFDDAGAYLFGSLGWRRN